MIFSFSSAKKFSFPTLPLGHFLRKKMENRNWEERKWEISRFLFRGYSLIHQRKWEIENGSESGKLRWGGGERHQRVQCVARSIRGKSLADCSSRNWSVINGQQETSLTLEAIRKVVLGNLRVFSDSENNLENNLEKFFQCGTLKNLNTLLLLHLVGWRCLNGDVNILVI